MNSDLSLFSGNSNPEFAGKVGEYLDVPVGEAYVGRFSDGEVQVEIQTSVRDSDVFIVQSLSEPVNDNLMELLAMTDAVRRSSADSVTAVIPYFGYARQDRQPKPRTPITAKLVADVLEVSGVSRVVTVDLHAKQIQGFFTRPLEHLYASPVFIKAVRQMGPPVDEMVIVSPDSGGVERARHYSQTLGCPLAILDKRRNAPNVSEMVHVIGDVEGKHTVLVDDMIDTAGTLTRAADALIAQGAASTNAVATHPVFSGPAVDRIAQSHLDQVLVTDTIPLDEAARSCETIEVVSAGEIVGEAISRIHGGNSVSSIFDAEIDEFGVETANG